MAQSETFASAVRAALNDLSISQATYRTGISYEYLRTMATYGRIPSEAILEKFARGLDADLHKLRIAAGYEQAKPSFREAVLELKAIATESEDVTKEELPGVLDLLDRLLEEGGD